MATSASRTEASATVAMAWLFAGLRISRVPPSRAEFHSPLMKRLALLIMLYRLERPRSCCVSEMLNPLGFAFLDKDLQSLAAEVFHQRLVIKRLGHHDTAFFDLARHQEFRCQRGRDAGLHFGERATELLVHLAMVVHGVDEIFDPFP